MSSGIGSGKLLLKSKAGRQQSTTAPNSTQQYPTTDLLPTYKIKNPQEFPSWPPAHLGSTLTQPFPTTSQLTIGNKSNLSNTASLLWHCYKSLPAPSNAVNWAGFYTLDPSSSQKQQLILGPFQGKVACQTILFGRGVCGTAAATKQTQLVPDVEKFSGHIACDGDTKSEIVVPIIVDDRVVAIIDIDCTQEQGFDEVDKKYLQQLADFIAESCDWP